MQRDYTFLEATVALCPHCLTRLDGKIIARGGRVYVSRHCPEHGPQLDLLEEDRDYFEARQRCAKPATRSQAQTRVHRQCPFDCGLCPNHEQHTCIALMEITDACDLACPVCYAHATEGNFLSVASFERMLDFALATEGGALDILQLSGGEPTLHPHLGELIALARRKGVKYVLLNTNGLRLGRDADLRQMLAGIPDRFEVYLQFDGLSADAHARLRGQALADTKLEILARLSASQIPTTLVMSVATGLNEGELGATTVRALHTPFVRGVSFQPLAYFGRLPADLVRRLDRMTVSGVIQRLETQMKGMIRREHLAPLPCDPDRVAIGYFTRSPEGAFAPLATRQDVETNLEQIPNTLRFNPDDLPAGLPLPGCSGGSCCGDLAGKVRQFLPKSFFTARSLADKARIISQSTFRITISSFVDAYNFDLRSCQRDCVHVITPDLRKIPFSAYNLCHRQNRSVGKGAGKNR